jgi:hypothetical protein
MPEIVDKTVMTEWAESSKEFSAAMRKLLGEFGFAYTGTVRQCIREVFPAKYLELCGHSAKVKYDDFPKLWELDPEYNSAVTIAKAILCASAILETNDIRDIIKWANA